MLPLWGATWGGELQLSLQPSPWGFFSSSPLTLSSVESPDASITPCALTTLGLAASTLSCNSSNETRCT